MKPRGFDLAVAVWCAVVAIALYLGARHGQSEVWDLSSDAGNITSFVAAGEHPELFRDDELLGDPHNFAEYMTLHLPLTRGLAHLTGGDYGAAFLLPMPLLSFLQLFGFYLLGRMVFRSRPFGLALAAASLCVVQLPGLAEYWGLRAFAIPREWFQAVLPWILCAAWRWRSEPRAWAAVLFAMGLTMYVHPVSAPGWTAAIWLGFLVSRPPERRWRRQLGLLLACTPAFFVAALPFVLNYLGEHEYGGTRLPYQQVIAILEYRFAKGFTHLPAAIGDVAWHWTKLGILPAGVAGAAVVWRLAPERRADLVLVLTWLGGILLLSTIVPLVEHSIARSMHAIPVEVDLVRGLRYVPPLLELLALWGAAVAVARFRRWGEAVAPVVLLALLYWVARPAPQLWGKGAPRNQGPRIEALLAVRDRTPEGATILPTADIDALPVRYLSRRAVVYAFKDGGMLGYANHEALVRWYERAQEMKALAQQPEPQRTLGYLDAARRYGARYLLLKGTIDEATAAEHDAAIVLANQQYALLRLD